MWLASFSKYKKVTKSNDMVAFLLQKHYKNITVN